MNSPLNPETEKELDQITEGLYRWTIDTINMAIEASKDGLKQSVTGTGTAKLLSPSETKAALIRLLVKERREVLYDLQRTNWITNQLYQGEGVIKLSTLIEVIDQRIAELERQIDESHTINS